MQDKGRLSAALTLALAAAFSFAGMQPAYGVDGISIPGNSTYVEQASPQAVAPDLEITSATGFAGKYVQARISSTVSGESLSLIEDLTPNTTLNEVSIVGGKVHVGKGSTTEIVGEIDSTRTGSNGVLRVNFVSSFTNANFENGTTTGWTAITQRIILGQDSIAGYLTVDTTNYASASCRQTDDNLSGIAPRTLHVRTATSIQGVTIPARNGAYFLELSSTSVTGPSGYVMHGPAAYSEPFQAAAGQTLSFDWIARNGGDNFHVYAALLSTDTSPAGDRWTEIIDEFGTVTNWATKDLTVPYDGNFRFVFVSGTDDASCGRAAGASLFIDNVSVQSSNVATSVAQAVLRKVAYANSNDAPNASDSVVFTAENQGNVTFTQTTTVNVTPVNDAPAVNAAPTITFVNSDADDSFSVQSGTINATDVDGDALQLSAASASAESNSNGGNNYDQKLSGTLADIWFDSTSLKYAVAPKDAALEQVNSPLSEVFALSVSDSVLANSVQITVRGVYDMKAGAPAISAIESSLSSDSKTITYVVQFDEYVDGFASSDITITGTSGAVGTWLKSEPELISGTTKYRFTVSNVDPVNGTVDFSLTTAGIQDFANPPNNLAANSVSGSDSSQVTIEQLPEQSLGAVATLNASPGAVFPNYSLDAHGDTIYGARLSVLDAAGNYISGDHLKLTNASGMGNIATATSTDGVLSLVSSGNTATAAQWQAAIRAVRFSTSQTAEMNRVVTLHIEPTLNYLADTGHFYQKVSSPNYSWKNWQQSLDQAASLSYRGLPGYMANITSDVEQSFLAQFSAGSGFWLGMHDPGSTDTWSFATGPESGDVFFTGRGNSGQTQNGYVDYWDGSKPNGTSEYAMFMTTGAWDDLSDSVANSGNYLVSILMVEFGDEHTPQSFGLVASASLVVDANPPTVVSVSSTTADGSYVRGESIDITVLFSEAVTVTGTPQLTLETGANDRTANYVSGSGTQTLVFRYVVQSGDSSSDLAYSATNSLALNSGAIRDAALNNALLTLPAVGASSSLDGSREFAVNGSLIEISLSRSVVSVSGTSVSWVLSATDALDCNSLSTVSGVDFIFTGLASIDSVTATNSSKTCTISGTSSILPARFGTTAIALGNSFSVTDANGIAHSTISRGVLEIDVTVPPSSSGKGFVESSQSPGIIPTQIERVLSRALWPGVSAATLQTLKALGIVDPPPNVPGKTVRANHSGITNPAEVLNSRARSQVSAGEGVSVELLLDTGIASGMYAASYIKAGSSWVFGGATAFNSGSVSTYPMTFTNPGSFEVRVFVVPLVSAIATDSIGSGPRFGFHQLLSFLTIPESSLPSSSQSFEVVIEVVGQVATVVTPATPTLDTSPPPSVTPPPVATPTPSPVTPAVTPTPVVTPIPKPTATTPPQTPSATPEATPTPTATPTPASTPTPTTTATQEPPVTPNPVAIAEQPEPTSNVFESLAEVTTLLAGAFTELLDLEITPIGEPVANAAIGASGDDSVIVDFDPLGTPEAVAATTNLVAASVALLGAAAAAAAAVGAASAAGAASSAASSGSASSSSSGTTETTSDATDAIVEAGFDVDAFSGTPPGKGDTLPLWSMAWLTFLDRPTRASTISTHRFSPLLSKLINDGIYLRASLGSFAFIPFVASIVLAIVGLQENAGVLLHPPVLIFMAIALIGIFDSMAGAVGIGVFVLGSLPLVDIQSATDWRMLAATMVAGFGPIVLGRSIRNFRRRSVVGLDGLLARLGDIAFVGLMGGWAAGLAFRALPALTGLTVPAANYVATFQFYATVAIVVRILLEDGTGRLFPRRMDLLSPDELEPVSKIQAAISLSMKFLFFVFIASSFMGLGLSVWLAASIFIAPSFVKLISHKLPNSPTIWRWLPVGLPGLTAILGLEILMNALLTPVIGDRDDYGVIFTLFLLGLISLFGVLGSFGREGREGEVRLFERASLRWVARIGAVVIFALLIKFTSML